MNIAEFFVSLGVKGSEKTIGAVQKVAQGMKGLWNSSIEAKIAIMGAFYGLQQLTATSNRTGTELKQFTVLTGMSARMLQQYEYAAQQVVGHNVELADTFKGLQDRIKDMLGGQGGGFQYLGAMVNALKKSGITVELDEAKRWLTDVPLLMQRMQQFAALPNVSNIWKEKILSQMGATPDLIQAMLMGGLTPGKLEAAKPYTYSDAEVDRLTRASTAWANMGTAMERSVGRFNAEYGPEMAKNLEKIVEALLGPKGLVPALAQLSDSIKAADSLNTVFSTIAHEVETLAHLTKGDLSSAGKSYVNVWKALFGIKPKPPSVDTNTKTRDVNINTKVNVYGSAATGADIGSAVGKSVKRSVTQIPTLLQAN